MLVIMHSWNDGDNALNTTIFPFSDILEVSKMHLNESNFKDNAFKLKCIYKPKIGKSEERTYIYKCDGKRELLMWIECFSFII